MSIKDLVQATRNARARTGDDALSTSVRKGRFSVCRVTYPAGRKSHVEYLTDFLPLDEAVRFLDAR